MIRALNPFVMKIQLTKNKTIELGGGAKRAPTDVVGIELDYENPKGCPAVRLVSRRKGWSLVAAGYVPPPPERMPASWEEMKERRAHWSLPPAFQAPVAAIAVNAPGAVARETSLDGIRSELGDAKLEISPNVPFSKDGRRFVISDLADEGFVLQSELPECQTLWLGRLFPEGRRPTVGSVQVASVARLGAMAQQPEFLAAEGSGMCMFVSRNAVHFAGWHEGRLALFRQCPGASGWGPIREAVKARLSLDESLVDGVLEGTMVDPGFILEPFVKPVFRELTLSIDYLMRRKNVRCDWVYLLGLPSGGGFWNQIAESSARLSFIVPHAFDGLEIAGKKGAVPELTSSDSQMFFGALGAARALMEEQP